ncbi:MAG TPA: tetratricopeptide repeat protein [Kofleriaceae bacterium]|nr:tetratricopeptide repeat protein [Kofleriaceae bacterium]
MVRGSDLLKQGKLDLAQQAFRAALEIEPENTRVLALLGLAHFRAGEFSDARAVYERLVERLPTDASHRLNLGLVYLKLNDADRAIAALEASRALDPSQGRAVSYLGLAYARAGRYGEAYRAFLIAGQNDLAIEIESNLTDIERDRIHVQLGRTPQGPLPRVEPAPVAAPAAAATLRTNPASGSRAPATVARLAPMPAASTPQPGGPVTPSRGLGPPPASSTPRGGGPVTPSRGLGPAAPSTPQPGGPVTPSRGLAPQPGGPVTPSRGLAPQPGGPVTPSRGPGSQPGGPVTPSRGPGSQPGGPVTPSRGLGVYPEGPLASQGPGTPAGGVPRTRPPAAPPPKARPTPLPGAAVSGPAAAAEPAPEITITGARDGAVRVEPSPLPPPPSSPGAFPAEPSRVTNSMEFVMPRAEPVPVEQDSPFEGASMISREIAIATPVPATSGPHAKAGGVPPRPLSEIATDQLLRPDDGDDPFEIGASGALIIRVAERMMTRLDGVHITGGDLSYELAMRRSRGHNTDSPFDYGGSQLHTVTGRGYLIAVPGAHAFSALSLDDDILYLREDLVFAFQASLRWENGNVPGLRGKLPVVQFRGHGALALRLARPFVRVKLPAQSVVFVDADRLAGWIGRVIPRAVVPPVGGPLGAMCVECTGEGIVLIEPAPEDQLAARPVAPRSSRPPAEVEAAMVAPIAPPADRESRAHAGTAEGGDPDLGGLDRLDEL